METVLARSLALATVLAASLATPALALTVNVNNAQQSELQAVKGLDKPKAKAIIEWRAENGSIENFTELEEVPGITPAVIEKVKSQLAFEGDPWVNPRKPAPKRAEPRRR